MIFKIQKDFIQNDTIFIYNRNKKYIGVLDYNGELEHYFKDRAKIYVSGYYDKKNGRLEIDRLVKDRKW